MWNYPALLEFPVVRESPLPLAGRYLPVCLGCPVGRVALAGRYLPSPRRPPAALSGRLALAGRAFLAFLAFLLLLALRVFPAFQMGLCHRRRLSGLRAPVVLDLPAVPAAPAAPAALQLDPSLVVLLAPRFPADLEYPVPPALREGLRVPVVLSDRLTLVVRVGLAAPARQLVPPPPTR